jgi:hypothetical protein
MATHACQTCGRLSTPQYLTGGRCPRCALYWAEHGVEYPPRGRPAGPATLPDVRPAQAVAPPRALSSLLQLLAPHRPRAPARAVAAARRMTERVCRICGRPCAPRQQRAGRCVMCAMYWSRHGVERPAGPPRSILLPRPCTHCGRLTTTPARGWCNACYRYWRRHHAQRPLDLHSPRPCQTCGRLVQQFHRGRCNPCYQYWSRTGRERPQHPPRRARAEPRPCGNCGQWTATLARSRCHACYEYHRRYGRERPARLWERPDG